MSKKNKGGIKDNIGLILMLLCLLWIYIGIINDKFVAN